ncbi:MAG: helix-turn-helix transcriptional regulator [Oscillospiraceae bacterium]|jgi:transcriptional regulator with XRE-family HTH domain|nr:helix-turn-helix transcriptional regulator [Oscillospiraceae bacterium]
MDIDYVRRKITELRIKKGLSEYRLSYDTGHSKNYIHNIVMGHSQPSVSELLYLIEVLGVTPRDFFDEETEFKNPLLAKKIVDGIKDLPDEDLEAILLIIERLNKKSE